MVEPVGALSPPPNNPLVGATALDLGSVAEASLGIDGA